MVIEYYLFMLLLVIHIFQKFQKFGPTKIGNKFTYINTDNGWATALLAPHLLCKPITIGPFIVVTAILKFVLITYS